MLHSFGWRYFFLISFFSYDPMYEQEISPILVVKSSFILNFKKMISAFIVLSTTQICTEMRCCAIMLLVKNSLWMFVRLFSIVCFHMCPLIVCIFTLVAFVFFFSTVCFPMSPQIACLRKGIATLVAFIRLFSTVCLQMSPQITFLRGCINAIIAFG